MNKVPLSQITEPVTKWNPRDHPNARFNYIDLSSVDNRAKSITSSQTIRGYEAPSRARQLLRENDVLVSTVRPNLNAVALVDTVSPNTTASTGFSVLRASDEIDPRYLFHWVQSKKFVSNLTKKATGASYPAVSDRIVKASTIPLPPPEEQRRIAAILDQADAIRAKRHLEISKWEDLRRAQFSDLPSKASELKRIPLQEAYWFQEGPGVRKWQFTRSGVKLLNVGNIESNGKLNLLKTDKYVSEEEAAGRYKHFLVDSGDLVMASSGISIQPDGLLATRSAFVDVNDLPLCMNTSTIRFKDVEGISTLEYLHGWFQSKQFRAPITRLVTGSAQKNFGPSHLKKLYIDLPDTDTQKWYADNIRSISERSTLTQRALDRDNELFASLQSRAFRGEL